MWFNMFPWSLCLMCAVLLIESGIAAENVPCVLGDNKIMNVTGPSIRDDRGDDELIIPGIYSSPNGSIADGGDANLTSKDLKEIFNNRIEPTNPNVRDTALLLVAKFRGYYTIDQISSIYRYLKNGEGPIDGWSYKYDPLGSEYFSYANESLMIGDKTSCAGAGDCEDFAILMSSLIQSIGGATRIILTHNNSTGWHAYTEVYLGQLDSPNDRVNDTINWMNHEFNKEGIYCHLNTTTKDVWLNLDWGLDENGYAYPGEPFSPADIAISFPASETNLKRALLPPHVVHEEASQSPAVPLNLTAAVLESGSAEVWFNKGIALNDLGKYDDAIQAFNKAIELNPKFAAAWNNKGLAFNNQGKLDEAIKAYDEATKVDRGFALAWNNKGNALKAQGKYDEAIAAYDEAVKLKPDFAWAWNGKGLALYNIGLAFNNQGKLDEAIKAYDDAIDAYEEAIGIDTNHPEAKKNLAQAWNNKGNALKAQPGKQDEAIAAYDEAIKLKPDFAWAWNGKGLAWNDKGNILRSQLKYGDAIRAYDEAINAYIEAIRIEPSHPEAQTNLDEARDNQKECKVIPEANILYPRDGVPLDTNIITAYGTIAGELVESQSLWLLVGKQSENQWWPQGGGNITPINGEWEKGARIGEPNDFGLREQMILMSVDEQVNQDLEKWVVDTNRIKDWYPINLPKCKVCEVLAKIEVVRSNELATQRR